MPMLHGKITGKGGYVLDPSRLHQTARIEPKYLVSYGALRGHVLAGINAGHHSVERCVDGQAFPPAPYGTSR
eukprot:1318711-Pyramimonas_sp.AAC.1